VVALKQWIPKDMLETKLFELPTSMLVQWLEKEGVYLPAQPHFLGQAGADA
jgi:hypothetical protein